VTFVLAINEHLDTFEFDVFNLDCYDNGRAMKHRKQNISKSWTIY